MLQGLQLLNICQGLPAVDWATAAMDLFLSTVHCVHFLSAGSPDNEVVCSFLELPRVCARFLSPIS